MRGNRSGRAGNPLDETIADGLSGHQAAAAQGDDPPRIDPHMQADHVVVLFARILVDAAQDDEEPVGDALHPRARRRRQQQGLRGRLVDAGLVGDPRPGLLAGPVEMDPQDPICR
ncbi:hypothetical protein AUC69_09065 [Methyloceanibacter superfactus]|uniref:Uncharacterized protein n=1 Tax=Methyloceanibacter superfactus TaxID=1774969 RepID=A0A1E3W1R2_9HYPH|nr:hypothetical protein AUC69_09065 [Methyloceanibacter superfactus]